MIFLDKHPNLIGRQSAKTPGADPFAGEMAHRQDFRPAHQHCWSFTEVKQITFSGKPRAPAVAGPLGIVANSKLATIYSLNLTRHFFMLE
ncbi:MAG: hypothetical protein ACXW6R_03740 [Candidatus Binatia bacterium]